MNCCDTFGNCSQGRDCPARQPVPAEAATEVGAEPLIPINTRLTRREAWGLVAIMAGPWAVIAAIAFWMLL